MRRRLMPHQSRALAYLLRHRHGALFMAMRTGKTLTMIRRVLLARPRRVLVVAPNSALGSWERELRLEGEEDVMYLQGARETRLALLRAAHRWNLLNKEGWMVLPEIANRARCPSCGGTGQENPQRGMPRLRRTAPRCPECRGRRHSPSPPGDRVAWDAVILDESTFIKSPKARVTRFMLEHLRPAAARRYILTGLPNPEGPLDYWCQFAFLDGRAFGCRSYWQFRSLAMTPDESGYGWVLLPGLEAAVRGEVQSRAFVCSRQDARMPERHVRQTRRLDLPTDLRRAYRRAEHDYILEYDGARRSTIHAVARWQWLRQICGGFIEGRVVWDGKADELIALLAGELAAEQVVVWFAYNQEIAHAWDRRAEVPGEVVAITGATEPPARRAAQARFASGRTRVLLLQQKIAEYGMDLSAADTAIYYSRHAALQTNAQCQDRIVHPRKKNDLLHVDLAVRDSVDEDVADALISKRWTSQQSLDQHLRERIMGRTEV